MVDLYNEKAGLLDGDADTEVDLCSYAFQIWNNEVKGQLFDAQDLHKAIQQVYRYPSAIDTLNRQLRSGISDQTLAELVVVLHSEDRLCQAQEREQEREPQIICSMGLLAG